MTSVLPDRIEVNYYTTIADPLENYKTASAALRTKRMAETSFLRIWCLQMDGFKPTTKPPTQHARLTKDVYSGKIPQRELDQHVLLRDIKLGALDTLDSASTRLAVTLGIPHHKGAGGEDDFI